MIRVGCTGHQTLSPSTRRQVAAAVAGGLASQPQGGLVGMTSLAQGADQLFAFAVLAAGGDVHAVIPSRDYEESFTSTQARDAYKALLSLAAKATTLPYLEASEDAYLAAGQQVVDNCDILMAIWDGKEAVGRGGTGDVVAYARGRGVEIQVIWPDGAERH